MRINHSLSYSLTLPFFTLISECVFAQTGFVETDVTANFNQNDIESECYVFVEEEAPYSHINGDCRLYRNHGEGQEDLVALNTVYNSPLGPFPRSQSYLANYYAIYWGTADPDSVYCAKMGSETGNGLRVIFGHHEDSNQNLELAVTPDCESLQQPATPAVHLIFMFCDYKTPRFDLTWSTSDSSIPVDFFEGQRWSGSSWQPWYTGGEDCLITNGSIGGVDYRIRGVNQAGASQWFTVTLQGCGGDGGPGPG